MSLPAPFDRLVDPRVGIIRRLARRSLPAEAPASLITYGADVADARRFAPVTVDLVAMGASFDDPERALRAAGGEAIERYCGNFVPVSRLRRASYDELISNREQAIDPSSLVLYSEAQYEQPGFPFVQFRRDLVVRWVEGVSLADGAARWVPASLCYINYHNGPLAAEPRVNFVMYSGVAAGETRKHAELSALLELVERDATMVWWYSGMPCEAFHPGSPFLRALLASPRNRGRLRYRVIRVPSRFTLPVIGVFCEDLVRQLVALGTACRLDPLEAVAKAAAEAVHLWTFALGLLEPDGHIWQAVAKGVFDARAYRPFRADRSYRDSFRADFHDMVDLGSNAQYYLDPSTHHLLRRIREAPVRHRLDALPRLQLDMEAAHDAVVGELVAAGFEPVSVRLTTSDVAEAGLEVVRVVVPGLVPNGPAAFPFLGSRRIREEPMHLGFAPGPIEERDLILDPLPHA